MVAWRFETTIGVGSSENERKEVETTNEELFEGILLCVCGAEGVGAGQAEKQQQLMRPQGQETNG